MSVELCEAGYVVCERTLEQVCAVCDIQQDCEYWRSEEMYLEEAFCPLCSSKMVDTENGKRCPWCGSGLDFPEFLESAEVVA